MLSFNIETNIKSTFYSIKFIFIKLLLNFLLIKFDKFIKKASKGVKSIKY